MKVPFGKLIFMVGMLCMFLTISTNATPTEYIQLVSAQTQVTIPYSTHGINSDFLLVKPIIVTGKQLNNGQYKWEMHTNHSHDVTITFSHTFTGAVYMSGPFETDSYDSGDLGVLFADGDTYDDYNYPPYVSAFANASWDSPIVRSFTDSSKYFRIVAPNSVSAIIWAGYNVSAFVRVYLRSDQVIIGFSTPEGYPYPSAECIDSTVCQVEYSIGGSSTNITWPTGVIPFSYGIVHNDEWVSNTNIFTSYVNKPRMITRKGAKRTNHFIKGYVSSLEDPEKVKKLAAKQKIGNNRFTETAGGSGIFSNFTATCPTTSITYRATLGLRYISGLDIQIPWFYPPLVVNGIPTTDCIRSENPYYLYWQDEEEAWHPIGIWYYPIIQSSNPFEWDTGGGGLAQKVKVDGAINWCIDEEYCGSFDYDFNS